MQAELDRSAVSHHAAAARLRHLSEVRRRARRAALAPSSALLALGAVAVIHGALALAWPHAAVLSAVWVGAVVAVRPVLRRARRRRGLEAARRLPFVCAAVAVAIAAVSVAAGASPLVSAVATAGALAASLAGMPAIAAAAMVSGLTGDALVAQGLAPAAGELIAGAGLLAAGLAGAAREGGG
jgi:hypothetical protein